jgi:dihydrolipoamide dehydrogenase
MIAGAGLNETQARQRHGDVRVAKFLNARNHRYHAMRSFEGYVKLIVGPKGDDRIIGVRAIGEQADNVIGTVAVLIDNGIAHTYLLDALQAHPSLGESLQNAARVIAGFLPPAL